MRVTVSHGKGREEARRLAGQAAGNLLRPDLPGPVRLTDIRKEWAGDVLSFAATVLFGPIRAPVRGTVTVLEREIVIEVELPPALARIAPETAIRSAVEARVRGLLNG